MRRQRGVALLVVMLILTIMIRPHGLFGRHDIERL